VRERAPVDVDLHGLRFDSERAWVVGDRGVILTRTPGSSWRRQPSGTEQTLRAVEVLDPGVVVVGDGGVILLQPAPGTPWQRLPSPTTRDLYAITARPQDFVGGAHGTLLARIGGQWRAIETGSNDDLRRLWDCSFNERTGARVQYQRAVCAGDSGDGSFIRCTVDGWAVGCTPQPPRSDGIEEARYGVARNHWMVVTKDGLPTDDALAVGSGGMLWRSTGGGFERAAMLDGTVELHAIATEELDWFVIGERGAIFHGTTEHALIWPITLL
jgi:photosystem II stability/assembly factor-like uncharacterized protein